MLVALTEPAARVFAKAALPGPAYRCPACRAQVTLVRATSRTSHFAHRPLAACPRANETAAHLEMKQGLYDLLTAAPWVSRVDLEVPWKSKHVDILVVARSGRRIVVECQSGSLTASNLTERMRTYAADQVAVAYVMTRAALGGAAASTAIPALDGQMCRFPEWSRPVWRATFDDVAGVHVGVVFDGGRLWALARSPVVPEYAEPRTTPETTYERNLSVEHEAAVRVISSLDRLEEFEVELTPDGSGLVARPAGTQDALLHAGFWNIDHPAPAPASPLIQQLLGVSAPPPAVPGHVARTIAERVERYCSNNHIPSPRARAALARADWDRRSPAGELAPWSQTVRAVRGAQVALDLLLHRAAEEIAAATAIATSAGTQTHVHMRAGGLETWQRDGLKRTLDAARGPTPVCVPLAGGDWARRPGGVMLSPALLVALRAHYPEPTDVAVVAKDHAVVTPGVRPAAGQ